MGFELGEGGGCQLGGQQAQTALQFAYGVLGIAAGVFLIVRASVPPAIEWGWVVALGFAGGVAAVAWGEAPIPMGIAGGVASAVVAFVIVWLGRRGRPPIPG